MMRSVRWLFIPIVALFWTGRAAAQDPDTTRPVPDTTRATPVVADTVRPIEQFVKHNLGPANGFTDGVWQWDRASLMLEAPVTLADLLERIPGVLTLRSGFYLQPEAASSLGGVGNRVEVWLDGYVLDPLLESSFDLSRQEVVAFESVRVERRLGTLRIFLETLTTKDNRAYSVVEAAVSQPNANLFRGIFLAPKFFFGPINLAIDRMDTNGRDGSEPADQFAGWLKWAFIRRGYGVQVEYRQVNTDRDPDAPWAKKHKRDDLIARARARVASGLVAELFAGRSKFSSEPTAAGDSVRLEAENMQLGGGVSFEAPAFWARGFFRLRDAERLPSTQLDAAAGAQFKIGNVSAQISQSDWRESGSTTEVTVRGEVGPRALRAFAEMTNSDRGVPFLPVDTVPAADSSAVLTSYEGYRVGAQAYFRGISVGAALVHAKTDSVTTFGLPFDRTRQSFAGGDATGWELFGRVPLPLIKGLYAEGMINDWRSGNVWLYTPTRNYRAGIGLQTTPLKSGNLEILGRIETIHRGRMIVPNLSPAPETPTITMPAVDYIDAYLQIRIIDVRAFMRYEDLTGQRVPDVPDRPLPGPRIIYGIKWQFFN